MRIPIFPLDTVLFPGGTTVLQIFEPRYLQMVKDCMKNESGFGICLVDDGDAEDAEVGVFNIGTYATIYDFEKLDNGLLGIFCHGNDRFTMQYDGIGDDDLHYGTVEWWAESEVVGTPEMMQPCVDYLTMALSKLEPKIPAEHRLGGEEALDKENLADPNWVSYRLAEILPLTNRSKQTILEMDDAAMRLKTLYAVVQTLDQGTRLS